MADDSGGFELVTDAKPAKAAPKKPATAPAPAKQQTFARTFNPFETDWSDPLGLGDLKRGATLDPGKVDWQDIQGLNPGHPTYKPTVKVKRTLDPTKVDWKDPLALKGAPGDVASTVAGQAKASGSDLWQALGDSGSDVLESYKHLDHFLDPNYHLKPVGHGGTTAGARIAGDAQGAVMAPISGTLKATVGQTIQDASNGKISADDAVNAIMAATAAHQGGLIPRAGMAPRVRSRLEDLERTAPPAPAKGGGAPQTQLQKNVADLKAAGIKPSLAAAGAKKSTQGLTRVLAPSVVGHPIRAAIRRTVGGLKDSAASTAVSMGDVKSAGGAGEGLSEGVERFAQPTPGARAIREELSPEARDAVESAARSTPSRKLGFGNKADILYERAERLVGRPNAPVDMPHLTEALAEAKAKFTDPALGEQFGHPIIAKLYETLEQHGGKMTWADARALRTTIREQLKSEPGLRSKVSETEVNRIYSGLTKDLEAGAEHLGGEEAGKAYKEANAYYAAGQGRIAGALQRVFNADSGDQVFEMMLKDGRSGAARNLERLNQVRKSVSPEEWRDFAASTLAHMGLAKPGEIGADGEFSFKTFLDNMNRLDTRVGSRQASGVDSGLKLLFEGVGEKGTYEKIRAMARSAELMRDLHQYSRGALSGEHGGSHLVNRGLMAGGGVALFAHNPLAAILTAMPPALTSWMLESPKFVELVAKTPEKGSPADVQSFLTKAAALAKGDPKASSAVAAMAASLAPALAAKPPTPEEKPKPPTDSKDEFPEDKFEIVGDDPHDGHPPGEHPMFWQDDPQGYLASYVGAPVVITSGYRTKEKQEALLEAWERGGRKGVRPAAPGASAHNRGEAFDFHVPGMSNEEAIRTLVDSGVPFDQIIDEGNHIHVSFDPRARGRVIGGAHYAEAQPSMGVDPAGQDDDAGADDAAMLDGAGEP